MSLRKKIFTVFLVSSALIAALLTFEYLNFVEIRKEIRYLELTDSIRSKTLQLRRHEKNYFLYPQRAEVEATEVRSYIGQLRGIAAEPAVTGRKEDLLSLKALIADYAGRFERIEALSQAIQKGISERRSLLKRLAPTLPFMEISIREHPAQGAELFLKTFGLSSDDRLITDLLALDEEIDSLRTTGERLIVISKDMDRIARERAERGIGISQTALLLVFPFSLVIGIATLFFIIRSVVRRLSLLMETVEKIGRGEFTRISGSSQSWGHDEVGMLIRKFNSMEEELFLREQEIVRKNKELLQSKKLAAIGTLAAGVAHELNNPLNNIHLSAQVLAKEASGGCSPFVKEILDDIIGQSMRVKGIVADLLEFARGRDVQFREADLNTIIEDAYKGVSLSRDTGSISFELRTNPQGVVLQLDPEQMERVFINLFSNAVDAMGGKGTLSVDVVQGGEAVKVRVSDTGKGMSPDVLDQVFEPFYTTKDKGTGLGLAIVFNTVRKHHGDIRVESEEGKGTAFLIRLPGT
ncbi:MAG: HAMP domain-containing protein [Nitrospirales bacterium]|nr:HAMP domain-containing protein [Nitrospirales bacterium]